MSGKTPLADRGDIWTVDFDPVRGHEQSGKRHALALSATLFNHGPAGTVVVLPITSRDKGIPLHVRVVPPEGGLSTPSFIKCDDVRSVSIERFSKRWGAVSSATMAEVEEKVRTLLQL